MSYPRKLLNPDESIVLDLNPHWRIFLAPGGLLVLALALLVVVAFVVEPVDDTLRLLSAVPLVLGLLWFTWRWIVWRNTHFVLTSDRVIYRSGVVSKHGQNIPLEAINNVASSQSVIERILRVGDLQIESAGETGRQTFSDVLNPSKVENRIYAEMEASKAKDASRAARAGLSVADEIAKFAQLRDQGLMTPEEFETQKARLLDRG